jgi:hypothetical protein
MTSFVPFDRAAQAVETGGAQLRREGEPDEADVVSPSASVVRLVLRELKIFTLPLRRCLRVREK